MHYRKKENQLRLYTLSICKLIIYMKKWSNE
jgi:hypothetical protein